MRILEFMSFDPSWFLTPAGLLISGGVLLLLIALIVFITTSKKDKGIKVDPTVDGTIPVVGEPENINNDMVNTMNNAVPTNMDNMMPNTAFNNPNNNIMGMMDNSNFDQIGGMHPNFGMGANNINGINPIPVPEIPNMSNEPQAMPGIVDEIPTPMFNNTTPEPIMPSNSNISFDNVPQATINDTANPEMQPVLDLGAVTTNNTIDFNKPVQEVSNASPSIQPETNSFINNNVRPIYGGANPLENTASIPTVMNHSAYNGEPIIPNSVVNEVKVTDNNQTTPISANDIFGNVNGSFEQQPNTAPVTETIVPPTPIEVNAEPLQESKFVQQPTSVVDNSAQQVEAPIETLEF